MESKTELSKTHFLMHYSVHTLELYMRQGLGYMINTLLNLSDKLIPLRYYVPEILFFVDLAIKRYYLGKHSATYAEYFYGFTRESMDKRIPSPHPNKSALLLAAYPYICSKMETYYHWLQMNVPQAEMTRLQQLFYYLFPLIHLLINLVDLLLKGKYLLVREAQAFDLLFLLLKTKLTYKNLQSTTTGLLDLLNKPLILCIFLGYKLLSWYYSSRSRASTRPDQIRTPQAPLRSEATSSGRKGFCAICGKKFDNPAMLSSSGCVYCYGCVQPFLRRNKKCPLTGQPSTQQNIHVLYP